MERLRVPGLRPPNRFAVSRPTDLMNNRHVPTPSPIPYDMIVIINAHSNYDGMSVQRPMPAGKLQTTIRPTNAGLLCYNPIDDSGYDREHEDLGNLFDLFVSDKEDARKISESPFGGNLFGASFGDLLLGVNSELKYNGSLSITDQCIRIAGNDPDRLAFIKCFGEISQVPNSFMNRGFHFYQDEEAETVPVGNITIYMNGGATKERLFEEEILQGRFICTKEDIIVQITQLYPYTHMVIIDLGCSGITEDFKGDPASLGYAFGGKKSKRKRSKRKRSKRKRSIIRLSRI